MKVPRTVELDWSPLLKSRKAARVESCPECGQVTHVDGKSLDHLCP